MACLVDSGTTFDCDNIPVGGLETELYIYNLTDWQGASVTRDADGNVTAITNGTGLQAYKFEMPNSQSILPQTALRAGLVDQFDHQLQFIGVDNTQAGRNQFSKMRFAGCVGIVLRKDGTGIIYGETQGLFLTDLQDNPADPDLGGIIQPTIATDPDSSPEPALPRTIWITDAETTRALVRSLTTVGP